MKEEEHNLFNGISLTESFDIPDVGTIPDAVEEVEKPAKSKPDKQEDEFDGFIDIPDTVETQEVVETKKDNTDTQDKEEDSKDKPSKQVSSSSPFKPFAKALFEEGVLSSFDEEEFDKLVEEFEGDSASALIELNRRTIMDEIESYKKESEEEYKAFLEARDAGVDLNDWASVQDNKKRFGKIEEESLDSDEKLQKQLITEDLKKRGFEEADIVDTIESYEDTNKLGSMAKKALKNLKKFEEQREEELKTAAIERDKKAREVAKKQNEDLKKQITSTDEIIPGLKLNKQVKEEIFTSIMQPVKTLEDGRQVNAVMAKRMEDPIKYAILEAYFVKQGFFDGKFDKLTTKVKSKAVEELAKAVEGDTSYKTGKHTLQDEQDFKEFDLSFKRIAR